MSLVSKEYLGSSSSGRRCQLGVLRHKGFPPRRIRLEQSLPGSLQHKPQPVQVVQATAPAQRQPEAVSHKLAHRLPVTVGCSDARLRRQFLHRRFQLGSLLHVQRGGEPPVCSKTSPLGPPSRRPTAAMPWPIGLWYGHPAPGLDPPPQPSIPEPAATPRATAPVPAVSPLGTSVAAPQPRPSATAPATRPSPAYPTTMPLRSPKHRSYLPQQFYPTPMRVSPAGPAGTTPTPGFGLGPANLGRAGDMWPSPNDAPCRTSPIRCAGWWMWPTPMLRWSAWSSTT